MVGLERKDFLRRKFIEGLARVGPLKLKDSGITWFSFSPSGFPKLHSVLSPIPAPSLLPSHLADSSSMSSSSCSPWDLFQVIIFVSHRLNCSSCLPEKNNPPPTNTHTTRTCVPSCICCFCYPSILSSLTPSCFAQGCVNSLLPD